MYILTISHKIFILLIYIFRNVYKGMLIHSTEGYVRDLIFSVLTIAYTMDPTDLQTACASSSLQTLFPSLTK